MIYWAGVLLMLLSGLNAVASESCQGVLKKRWGVDFFISQDVSEAKRFAQARLMKDPNAKTYVGRVCQDQVKDFFIVGMESSSDPGEKLQNEKIENEFKEAGQTFLEKKLPVNCGKGRGKECWNRAFTFLYEGKTFEVRNFLRFGCQHGHRESCELAIYLEKEYGNRATVDRLEKHLQKISK